MRDAMVNGFRNHCYLGIDGLSNSMYVWDKRAWNNSKDRQYLIRKPSFADPAEMARRRERHHRASPHFREVQTALGHPG